MTLITLMQGKRDEMSSQSSEAGSRRGNGRTDIFGSVGVNVLSAILMFTLVPPLAEVTHHP